jgi:hypothetical protein
MFGQQGQPMAFPPQPMMGAPPQGFPQFRPPPGAFPPPGGFPPPGVMPPPGSMPPGFPPPGSFPYPPPQAPQQPSQSIPAALSSEESIPASANPDGNGI